MKEIVNSKSCQRSKPYIPLSCQATSQTKMTSSHLPACSESTSNTRHTSFTSNSPLGFTKISPDSPLNIDHLGGFILTPNSPQQINNINNDNTDQKPSQFTKENSLNHSKFSHHLTLLKTENWAVIQAHLHRQYIQILQQASSVS